MLWAGDASAPVLRAVRCESCGTVAFPPQAYGCESCGGSALEQVEIAATGVLRSYALVHVHPSRPTPYTIGELELDAGPVTQVLLAGGVSGSIGLRVRGVVADGGLVFG